MKLTEEERIKLYTEAFRLLNRAKYLLIDSRLRCRENVSLKKLKGEV